MRFRSYPSPIGCLALCDGDRHPTRKDVGEEAKRACLSVHRPTATMSTITSMNRVSFDMDTAIQLSALPGKIESRTHASCARNTLYMPPLLTPMAPNCSRSTNAFTMSRLALSVASSTITINRKEMKKDQKDDRETPERQKQGEAPYLSPSGSPSNARGRTSWRREESLPGPHSHPARPAGVCRVHSDTYHHLSNDGNQTEDDQARKGQVMAS